MSSFEAREDALLLARKRVMRESTAEAEQIHPFRRQRLDELASLTSQNPSGEFIQTLSQLLQERERVLEESDGFNATVAADQHLYFATSYALDIVTALTHVAGPVTSSRIEISLDAVQPSFRQRWTRRASVGSALDQIQQGEKERGIEMVARALGIPATIISDHPGAKYIETDIREIRPYREERNIGMYAKYVRTAIGQLALHSFIFDAKRDSSN